MVLKRLRRSRVRTVEDLLEYFRAAEKPRRSWAVGVEAEKFGVLRESSKPIPYAGPRGVEAVLGYLAKRFGWRPVLEDDELLSLRRRESSITLEPGGQIELSGQPHRNLHDVCAEIHRHLNEMRAAGQEFEIDWYGVGVHPTAALDDIAWIPKERYRLMRRFLPTRGASGLHMMKRTCGIQANFDFDSEEDAAAKVRTAMGIAPVVAAIFANSPISAGRLSRVVSERQRIWFDTDPDRCGALDFVFGDGFGYRDYAEWALDVPIMLLVHNGRLVSPRGLTFRKFLSEGYQGQLATMDAWDLHLSSVFPDVRLRQTIEVRGADAVNPVLSCAVPAIWKGVLYDRAALAATWDLVKSWSIEERRRVAREVALHGLAARVKKHRMLDVARELFRIAVASLRRQSGGGAAQGGGVGSSGAAATAVARPLRGQVVGKNESIYLDPLRPFLFEWNGSPSEVFQRNWRKAGEREREKLMASLRY
jgi:glutamate--cysteine ligase